MNSKHPIDEFFHSKLQDFEMDPPMHLWENIEKKRRVPFWLSYKNAIGKGFMFLLVGSSTLIWWLNKSEIPEMGAFPIPINDVTMAIRSPNSLVKVIPTQEFASELKKTATSAVEMVLQKTADPVFPKEELTSQSSTVSVERYNVREMSSPKQKEALVAVPIPSLPVLAPVNSQDNQTLQQYPVLPVKRFSPRWKLSLQIWGAPEYALKKRSPQNNASDAFLQAQQNTEQAWLSYSTGIEIQAQNSGGFTFTTGLQYGSINEKFDFYNPSETRFKISEVKGPGNYLVDLDTIAITGQRWKTSRNYQTAIAIPLFMGYEKSKGKISIGVYGGPLIHIYNGYRKDLLDQEGYPVRLSGTSDSPLATGFPAAWQLSWQIRAGLQYNWTPKMQLFTAPQFRFSRAAGTTLTKENYWVGGLTMGVRTRIY